MVYPYLSLYFKNVTGIGYAEIGALILFVSIFPLAVSPFGGMIADRVGRRRVFLLSLGGEAASVLLIAVSMAYNSIPGVLAGGGLAGVCGSFAGPAISAYVADLAPQLSERTMAYTWVRIGFNAGFTVGVALGGSLIGFLGFPNTGILAACILGTATLFLLATLDPSPYDIARAHGEAAAAASSSSKPGSFMDSFKVLGKDRSFLVLCLGAFFTSMVYGHWSTTFPLYSNTILLVPYGILGIALALNGAIVVFGQNPMTRLMRGRMHTFSAIVAVLLMGASFIALGAISLVAGAAIVAVFTFVVILTVGENFGAIPSMTLPSNVAPATEIGSYNGVFNLIGGIGNSISPLIGGLVLASVANPMVLWVLLALPCIPAALLFQWVGTRIPKAANTV
jgi:MFS family permease